MTRQNKILTAYFVLGLPGLPIACMMWLIGKYIFQSKNLYSKEMFCSMMFTSTIFGIIYFLLIKYL